MRRLPVRFLRGRRARLHRLRVVADTASVWFITRSEHDLGRLERALDALEPGDWPRGTE